MDAPDAIYIRSPLGSIPEPLISGKCFYFLYIGELKDKRLTYIRFHEGDVERHHGAEGIRGELEGSDIEVLKYLNEKGVEKKRSPSSDDRLREGHHARRRKMWSFVGARLTNSLWKVELTG